MNIHMIRFYILAITLLAAITLSGYIGYKLSKAEWKNKYNRIQVELAQIREENLRLEAESEKITVNEVIRYVDRVRVVREKAQEIIREVPVYITPEDNDRCVIPDGFISLHNKAAGSGGETKIP